MKTNRGDADPAGIAIRAGGAELALDRPAAELTREEGSGGPAFRIRGFDSMPSFLMSLVSEGDHWLFASSCGALTCGRRDEDRALFPYCTDDRLHDCADQVGSKTVLRVHRDGAAYLWEPFSDRCAGVYRVARSLSKSAYGHELSFEELNEDLGLSFSYSWTTSGRYGFVRRAALANVGAAEARVELLDGLLGVMPAGLTRRFQAEFSNLADAYRDSELVPAGGSALALFRLSSVPVDRAEPSEALRANTVWSDGLEPDAVYLSAECLDAFRRGLRPEAADRVRGRRGAYLARAALSLAAGARREWLTVADVAADSCRVRALAAELAAGPAELRDRVLEDVRRGFMGLRRIAGAVDGLQLTGDGRALWRHYSNAMFNAMRGGLPADGYSIRGKQFAAFVRRASAAASSRCAAFLEGLPEVLERGVLVARARAAGDPDLERLAREYLPLTFSRRHGDPSRPWNRFSIATRDEKGERRLGYEGNWRDIFQNWEALALSYPGYLDGMIFKFLDSSTADGYNPYRISLNGIEWEVIDEADAWSFIGYWGDHQAAYLLRLLEASDRYYPGALGELLDRRIFPYAQVPYRIKDYRSLLADPKATVEFDAKLHGWIIERSRTMGEDGKLLRAASGEPVRASLAEKLLVPILAKLSNYVPDAGIWMNTQRPEWNDANNALVGNGVSVVTLCYLRGLLAFCRGLFAEAGGPGLEISAEVVRLGRRIGEALGSSRPAGGGSGRPRFSPAERGALMDALGEAGSDYRQGLYEGGLSGVTETVAASELVALCDTAIAHLDCSLRANRRDDGLYHAYNLMRRDGGVVGIRRLPVMLEGQAAILSSGLLSCAEAAELLEALRASELYDSGRRSYLLYPDRRLPSFLEKNNVPAELAARSRLLAALEREGDGSIVSRDLEGGLHFNADFRNARALKAALARLAEERRGTEAGDLAEAEAPLLEEIYEKVFDHQSFTGRSGSFYKYEGLGSIYWHMVSKLLLAVGETISRTREPAGAGDAERAALERLEAAYREIREGLGAHKSPTEYGAFPTDPYSHTPSFAGAQQPGMTGQVKEDLISRLAELGAHIEEGRLSFRRSFAAEDEALIAPAALGYVDVSGEERLLEAGEGCYAFTVCQVPVVVHARPDPDSGREGAGRAGGRIEISRRDGSVSVEPSLSLGAEDSALVFSRSGRIAKLDVFLDRA
jgi:hypothetical protein